MCLVLIANKILIGFMPFAIARVKYIELTISISTTLEAGLETDYVEIYTTLYSNKW